jgi:radical SAM superfamily enzyme
VKNTKFGEMAQRGEVRFPEMAEYVGWVVDFLELLPTTIVIDRLSGDAPAEYLIGPLWSTNKSAVKQAIEAEFRRRGSHQGKKSA